MSQTTSSYADCVATLRTSLSFLESSVTALHTGVADYPRLGHVLKSVRV
jgi:DASH complex subunit SPC19